MASFTPSIPSKPRSPAQQFEDLRKATIAVLSGSYTTSESGAFSGVTNTHKYLPKDIVLYIIQFIELSEFRIRLVTSLKKEFRICESTVESYRDDFSDKDPYPGSRICVQFVRQTTESSFVRMICSNSIRKFWEAWFNYPHLILPNAGKFGRRKDSYNKIWLNKIFSMFIIMDPSEFNKLFVRIKDKLPSVF